MIFYTARPTFQHAAKREVYFKRIIGEMQKSRLLSLPRELTDMIMDSVGCQQDLSSLCKTGLDLREAALPFLFRNIEVADSRGRNLVGSLSGFG
jgi:hypothetical protein